MTAMDTMAMLVGYATMIIGGVGLLLAAAWFAADGLFRLWHHGWNMGDLMDATREWRRAHPDKYARWKKRNGVDGEAL